MKKILTMLIVFCAIWSAISAHIIEATSLEIFEKALETADASSLVLFDVDETLIMPEDLIFRPSARANNRKMFADIIEDPSCRYSKDYLVSRLLKDLRYRIVDPNVMDLIESLKARHIKTIAFTRMKTGSLGVIPSLEDWRLKILAETGFNFESAFPKVGIAFKEMEQNGMWPVFKEGVLFAGYLPKGPVLMAFLEAMQLKPSTIYFLDNNLSYLQSVEEALKATEIDFRGFYYTAAENAECIFDDRIAEYQFRHFAKEAEWLSDEAALKKMNLGTGHK